MKIAVIDDHPLVRQGLESVMCRVEDFEIVEAFANGREALAALEKVRPDVVLVDLRLPDEHGIEIVRKARLVHKTCKYIILTSFATEEEIQRALDEEVDGYILKETLPEELINAIRIVYKGRKYYDPAVIQFALTQNNDQKNKQFDELTRREQEVLSALAQGLNNKAIAEKLVISQHTVKKHIGQILDKLHLKDRTQAALYAVSKGFHKKYK